MCYPGWAPSFLQQAILLCGLSQTTQEVHAMYECAHGSCTMLCPLQQYLWLDLTGPMASLREVVHIVGHLRPVHVLLTRMICALVEHRAPLVDDLHPGG